MPGAVVTPQPEVVEEGHRSSPTPVKCGLLRTNSPLAQVCLIGLVCFCCPGMFNGRRQCQHRPLRLCFAVFGILGGAAHNLLGPRTTLLLGALTYPLYDASFLYYNHCRSMAFPVAAGAILGAGAGLLWAAQGAIITAYPPPKRRGTYISIFWCLYNFGGVFGGLFPFSLNYHRGSDAGSVNDGTYIAFMVFMLLGSALALLILPPSKITPSEGAEILKIFTNWKMLLVFPAAWDNNFFYTYQFNNGLNNVFYWGRGFIWVIIVATLGTAIWGGGLATQLRYKDGKWEDLIDFKDGRRYASPFLLFFSYGLLDAIFQSLVYWIIAALSDDSQVLSRYIGFYNGAQSAGAAVAWQVNRHKTSLISQLFVNCGLMTFSCPLLALLVFLAVKDEASTMVVKDEDSLVP
ncbi:hypothetical protein CFC21_094282 [Triticum aestivum]|uniref:Uncharacterized protein n=2 Tax=Triticum aestivum TaxID=4565 RepID=A0A3B6QJZ1_WHEAT|nr:hypothetical protein CFC21_094282 [Triticum aestivum]